MQYSKDFIYLHVLDTIQKLKNKLMQSVRKIDEAMSKNVYNNMKNR